MKPFKSTATDTVAAEKHRICGGGTALGIHLSRSRSRLKKLKSVKTAVLPLSGCAAVV
jgi:hypothetical protein